MAAYALVPHSPVGPLARKDPAGRFLTPSDTDRLEASNSRSGWPLPDGAPSLGRGCLSEVLAFRAEIASLREEVQRVREELEVWKAESHKHFCDAQYWRAMHQKALERIAQRDQEIDRLKGQVRDLRQQLFGRKSEKGKAEQAPPGLEKTPSGRRRGQQAGGAGHGRRDHSHLPAVITPLDLPADERCCPRCGRHTLNFLARKTAARSKSMSVPTVA